MFKQPTNERLALIVDMIPEMVSVFSSTGKGYEVKIAQMGEFMRIHNLANELGVKVKIPKKLNYDFILELVKENEIPPFALVISKHGRYRISFEYRAEPAAIMLTRDWWRECIGGQIYIVSEKEITDNEVKRMKASGAECFYHLNTKRNCIL
jgi:hypothetical protein